MANTNLHSMAELEQLLFLVITLLILTIVLFLADKLIGDKPSKLDGGYFVKALITAVVIIVIIIGVGAVIGAVDVLGIGQIVPILAFVLSCYAIKMLLLSSSSFEKATWVGLVAWLFIYIINYLTNELFNADLLQYF